jgi:hypothetical protein
LDSSNDPARSLGALLTGSEAREIADHLADDDTLTASLRAVSPGRRAEIRSLLSGINQAAMITVLRAIEGARSAPTTIDPLWTMPGHLAQHGRLTQSVTYLVENARYSVVCSTFNFQQSSGLWKALQRAVQRPEIMMKVYMDTDAADAGPRRPGSPSTDEVAAHLYPALILRIDHRFLLVTSANFSWSAENANLEFGVLIDNSNLAEAIERELREAEDFIFERMDTSGTAAPEYE